MSPEREATMATLAELATLQVITRENVDRLLDSHQIEIHMKNGRWWSVRRNGATKRWKRDPMRIRVPIKFGFKLTGAIEDDDFDPATGAINPLFMRVKPPFGTEK